MVETAIRHKQRLLRAPNALASRLGAVACFRLAVTLSTLSNGHLSLEFAPSDMDLVASAIRTRFTAVSSAVYPTATAYDIGGCRFVFQNEWDDPCLISGSNEGDLILTTLCAALESAE